MMVVLTETGITVNRMGDPLWSISLFPPEQNFGAADQIDILPLISKCSELGCALLGCTWRYSAASGLPESPTSMYFADSCQQGWP